MNYMATLREHTKAYLKWMGDDPTVTDFQAMVRSPECKAALIVYEKYKRNYGLENEHLRDMHAHALSFSVQRQMAGKKAGKDLLVQEVSRYCKEKYGTAGRISAGRPAEQLVSQANQAQQPNPTGDLGQAPAPAPSPGDTTPLP